MGTTTSVIISSMSPPSLQITSSSSSSSVSLSSYCRLTNWDEKTCLDWRLLDRAPRFCLACRLTSSSVFLDFTSFDKNLNRVKYYYNTCITQSTHNNLIINLLIILKYAPNMTCVLLNPTQFIYLLGILVDYATRLIEVRSISKH